MTGPLVVPQSWTAVHDPAASMINECFLNLLSKCLYMALAVKTHHTAFNKAQRSNRKLAKLSNTMGVVWENLSDTIAILVQKVSGNVTSMLLPSFFRTALPAADVEDIRDLILEYRDANLRVGRGCVTDVSRIQERNLPDVGMKVVRKEEFFL